MAGVRFKRGNKAFIDSLPIVDGQLIFNTETGEIFHDVGNKRISTGNGGGNVNSVNGKTGAVILSASDVNAFEKPVGGVIGDFAVNDGAGGIVWKTISNAEEGAF